MFLYLSSLLAATLSLAFIEKIRSENRIRLLVCVIRPEQLGEVVSALKISGLVTGMTVMNVRGFGRQRADEDTIRFLPKLKLETLVLDKDVERAANVISNSLRTGQIGDGKIYTLNVRAVLRVRTRESGLSGL